MNKNRPGLLLLIYEYVKGILMSVLVVMEVNRVLLHNIPDFYKNVLSFLYPFFTEKLQESVTWYVVGFVINLVAFAAVLFLFRMADYRKWVRVVVVTALFTGLLGGVFFKYELYRISIAAVILYIFEGAVLFVHADRESVKKLVLSLVPFLMLPVFISFVGETSKEPLSWQWLKDAWQIGKEKIAEGMYDFLPFGESEEFSLEMAGFGSEDKDGFWGSVLNKRSGPKLYIEKINGRRGDGYLAGAIRDTYTGDGFVKEKDTGYAVYPEYLMNYYEILYNWYYSGVENVTPYKMYAKSLVEITYGSLETTSVFYPGITTMFGDKGSEEFHQAEKYHTEYLESQKGENYRVGGVITNMEHEALGAYLRQSDSVTYPRSFDEEKGMDEATWRQMLLKKEGDYAYAELMNNSVHNGSSEEIMDLVTSEEFADYLLARRDVIRERDLQLPESLPERVKELSYSLTKDRQTDYDKILSVRDYLKSYPYSVNVDKPHKKTDLVDYFLFENKKGYCVHFASSATVLLRCAGIPARYVEGFKADFKESRNEKYLVRSGNAHSWCEAYLEGYGWIRVEATPGYESIGISEKSWLKAGGGAVVSDNSYESASQNSVETEEEDMDSGQEEAEEWMEGFREVSFDYHVRPIIFFALLVAFAVVMIYWIRMKIIYEKASVNEKVRIKFGKILKHLQVLGCGIGENETLSEYRNRLMTVEWEKIKEVEELKGPEDLENLTDAGGYSEIVKILTDANGCSEIFKILTGYEEMLYKGSDADDSLLQLVSQYEKRLKKQCMSKYVLAFYDRRKYNLPHREKK